MLSHSTNVATLIAADALESGDITEGQDRLREAGLDPGVGEWIEAGIAADIGFTGDIAAARVALAPLEQRFDVAVQPQANRRKMLLVSDMDSTMITVECIDELADYAGIKAQIAAVTERAMAGELDFADALRARVALLAGLPEAAIEACIAERVQPMPGAQVLVHTMRGWGAKTYLVSGGFTHFANPVARQIGFTEAQANHLEIVDGHLTGAVRGKIVDAEAKRSYLQAAQSSCQLEMAQTLAVGDGANDIPMIEAAGIGVAYHAKPKAQLAADIVIRHNDLTALLFVQGIWRRDWARL